MFNVRCFSPHDLSPHQSGIFLTITRNHHFQQLVEIEFLATRKPPDFLTQFTYSSGTDRKVSQTQKMNYRNQTLTPFSIFDFQAFVSHLLHAQLLTSFEPVQQRHLTPFDTLLRRASHPARRAVFLKQREGTVADYPRTIEYVYSSIQGFKAFINSG
jgi:hypothetical protein